MKRAVLRGSVAVLVVIRVVSAWQGSGLDLERVGVTPDERVLPTAQDLAAGRDPVLARAIVLAGGAMTPDDAGTLFPTPRRK
jgi:hypothetical protein